MGMQVMVPSDTYHNFIQTHIAFTLYFLLLFWLQTASSRLKFYLNGRILTWGENRTLLSAISLIVYITAEGGFWPRAKSPLTRAWEGSRARQQPLRRCANPCWAVKVGEENLSGTCHPKLRLGLKHLCKERKKNKLPDKCILTSPPPKCLLHM